MEWTKTTPSEPGWYWQSDGRVVRTYYLMGIEIDNNLWNGYKNLYWQGPLEVPEAPKGD